MMEGAEAVWDIQVSSEDSAMDLRDLTDSPRTAKDRNPTSLPGLLHGKSISTLDLPSCNPEFITSLHIFFQEKVIGLIFLSS